MPTFRLIFLTFRILINLLRLLYLNKPKKYLISLLISLRNNSHLILLLLLKLPLKLLLTHRIINTLEPQLRKFKINNIGHVSIGEDLELGAEL